MGNACACVSKNKEKSADKDDNSPLPKELNTQEPKEDINSIKPEEKKPEEAKVEHPYPEPPESFKPDLIEPVGKDVIPDENEIPNCDNYDIPSKQLDDLAIKIGKYNFPSFNSLIYHLIYNRADSLQCNDYQKACALFTWLTTKNLHDLKNSAETIPQDSPEGILLGISTGKTAYAQVFQMLCRYAGLQCKLIRGYAKGVDYKPGMKLGGGKEAQHAWNAVKIDNVWYLFDCHWAARRLMGKSTNSDRVKYDLDLFYFMTNPFQLRYTHFPFEEDWQLVKKKIILEEFENLTLVKPTFFKYGLDLYSHTEAVLDVMDKLVLKIKIPLDLVDKICLTFTLTLEGLGEIYEGSNLTRYGVQETDNTNGVCTLSFRFPKSGAYKLLLYAREFGDQVFGGICEYRINSRLAEVEIVDSAGEKHTEEEKIIPYPPTQQPSYGRTEMACQYNLRCSHENTSTFRVYDGQFEVSFLRKDKEKNDFPRLMARLKSSFHEDGKLSSRILQRNTYDGNVIDKFVALAFLPDAGEYALEIYANNPEKEGSSFFLIWQLLLATEKGCDLPQGLPDINPGAAIGSQVQFSEFGLKCVSHPDPYIIVPIKAPTTDDLARGDIVVSIGLPEDDTIKILGQLVDVSSAEEELEVSDYLLQQNVMQSKRIETVLFHIRFPKGGSFYKLHIYGSPTTNETETLPMVFSYLINCPLRLGSSDSPYLGTQEGPYPYQLSQWKDKCMLFEPINRKIIIGPEEVQLNFKVQVPNAFHVAVVIAGEHWNQLSKTNEDNSLWSGEVTLSPSISTGSKITVCACYHETIISYSTILEYYTC